MIEKVDKYVNQQGWLLMQSHSLVAVSGGVDSMVLATLFWERKWPFAVAHVNYMLRAEESDADAAFVEAWCEERGVEVHVLEVNTKKIAADRKQGIQETARQLRYEWFEDICEEYDYDYLATAHHADDSLESSLFYWMRGSGLRGVRGILPERDRIIRPLLDFTKMEILAYAQAQQLAWREDASNATDAYTRNQIRHQVIPAFEQVDPQFRSKAAASLRHLQQAEHFIAVSLRQWEQQMIEYTDTYWVIDHGCLPASIRAFVLYESLAPFGFTETQLRNLLNAQTGAHIQSSSHCLYQDRGKWLLEEVPHERRQRFVYNRPLAYFPFDNGVIHIDQKILDEEKDNSDKSFCLINTQALTWPLKIRPWQAGDSIQLSGMAGKKKLKKLFVDHKLNPIEKARVRLLCNGDGSIIWVIGLRVDARFDGRMAGSLKRWGLRYIK